MFPYFSLIDSQSSNIAALLDKLASQPNGLENGLKLAMLLTPKPDEAFTIEDDIRRERDYFERLLLQHGIDPWALPNTEEHD